MIGKLIVVGTPIGNLSDISERALEILKMSDFIAAEDTRVSLKLLNHFGIKNKLVSYYEHNKLEMGKVIVDRILNGEMCALVSDAGMPAISDPGESLVRQCIDMNIDVSVIPGPCAAVSALVISGMKIGRFTFEGFLSINKKNRMDHLSSLVNETRTMIFYEAPHKFKRTLKDMYEYFGNRKITIVRELTKIHEEVIHTDLKSALERFNVEQIKGEIVIVMEGAIVQKGIAKNYSMDDAVQMVKSLASSGVKFTEAVKRTAKLMSINRNDLYKEAIFAKGDGNGK